jgi:hypothetical protein
VAPLAVAVEIRALDAVARAFRLSQSIDDRRLELERELPFEPGRPVAVELMLPDDDVPLQSAGVVATPTAITLRPDPAARKRLAAYVTERMLAP